MKRIKLFSLFFFILLFCVNMFLGSVPSDDADRIKAPENKPAELNWNGRALELEYNNQIILRAAIENRDQDTAFHVIEDLDKEAIEQVFKWTSRNSLLELKGMITASRQAFPCEAERPEDALLVVRHSVGLSQSLLNRAVYDRCSDWVLSVDHPSEVKIVPEDPSSSGNSFRISVTGRNIIIRFRPYYYQKHRGLSHFKPWTYEVWKDSVAGWCSWFAYFDGIDEQKIHKTARILSEELVPYGLEYLQIDDGYQQEPAGTPETWLSPNEKFPSGLESLCGSISEKGLKPGIWTYLSFLIKEFAFSHRNLFVLDRKGEPAYGEWVGYVINSSDETLEQLIKPLYRDLKKMGWKYFKVDALRHLRYEGYNSYSQYFEERGMDLVSSYRKVVRAVRDQIGDESFLLGCWGIRPELIGIIDGCRIGTDGFGYGGLAQYNSFNNVIWRNDPDHIELTEKEAYRSTMVTSLTGSLYMLTDKPELYRTEKAEAAKRTIPVLFTLPGQIFDVDPSRSGLLSRVDSEVSGSGPRVFDGEQAPRCGLYLMEMNTPFESWMLLGRIDSEIKSISFEDLGLSPEKEYFIFEFWSKELLGSFSEAFNPGNINSRYNCQLFCIRERKTHPQIIATNRHVSCGYELSDVQWKSRTLTGKSEVIGKDTYKLYISEPDGYVYKGFSCTGAEVENIRKKGILRIIELKSEKNASVQWALEYEEK
jgi:alpha-galactosidase